MGTRIKDLYGNRDYVISMFQQIVLDPTNKISDMCRTEGTTDSFVIKFLHNSSLKDCEPEGIDLFRRELIRRFRLYLNCFLEAEKVIPDWSDVDHSIGNIILHFLYIECIYAFKKFDTEGKELDALGERL